jgi:hypothetical protein
MYGILQLLEKVERDRARARKQARRPAAAAPHEPTRPQDVAEPENDRSSGSPIAS